MPSGAAGNTVRYNGTNRVSSSLIYNNGTNVGIGTTTPANKLSVNGNLRVVGGASINGTTLYVDNTTHRVGVGTSSPEVSLSLSVSGEILQKRPKSTTTTTYTYDIDAINNRVNRPTNPASIMSSCSCGSSRAVGTVVTNTGYCYFDVTSTTTTNYIYNKINYLGESYDGSLTIHRYSGYIQSGLTTTDLSSITPRCPNDTSDRIAEIPSTYETLVGTGHAPDGSTICYDVYGSGTITRYTYKDADVRTNSSSTTTTSMATGLITSAGNVGIRKTPDANIALDVVGNGKFSGNLAVGGPISTAYEFMLYGDTKIVGNLQFSDDHIANRINNTSTITSVSTTTLPTESAVKGYVSSPQTSGFAVDTEGNCTAATNNSNGSKSITATNYTFCYLTSVSIGSDNDKVSRGYCTITRAGNNFTLTAYKKVQSDYCSETQETYCNMECVRY